MERCDGIGTHSGAQRSDGVADATTNGDRGGVAEVGAMCSVGGNGGGGSVHALAELHFYFILVCFFLDRVFFSSDGLK